MTVHGSEHNTRANRVIWAYLFLIALLINAGILLAWLRPWKTETASVPIQAQAENKQQNEAAAVSGKEQEFDNSTTPFSEKPVIARSDSAYNKTASEADNILSHKKSFSAEGESDNAPLPVETAAPEREVEESIDPSNAEPFTHEATATLNMDMSPHELDTLRNTIWEEQNVTEDNAPMPSDRTEDVNTSTDDSILEFSQLPSEIKEALPDMSITGHIYSNDPMSRMVNINGSIIREGENVSGGLVVDEITLSGVIFIYKGFRFSMRSF
jgi:hypothetical protein